jgi:hypothetical protein
MIAVNKAQGNACATTGEYRYHDCHSIHHPKAVEGFNVAAVRLDAGGL